MFKIDKEKKIQLPSEVMDFLNLKKTDEIAIEIIDDNVFLKNPSTL